MKPVLLLLIFLLLIVRAYPQTKPDSFTTTTVPKTFTATAPTVLTIVVADQVTEKKSPIDIAGITAILGLLVALYTIYVNSELNGKAISVARFQDIYKEYTSDEFRKSLLFVRNNLQKDYPPDDETTLYDLKADDIRHATRVSHFFDFVGMLMAEKLLNEDLIVIFLGGSAEKTWQVLQPYINSTRTTKKNPDYQVHFENLAAVTYYKPERDRLKKHGLRKYPRSKAEPDNS